MKLGLALGGGGARGLAHILMLEALEELGVRPCVYAGASIGAVMAAAAASGMSSREIREQVEVRVFDSSERFHRIIFSRELVRFLDMFDPEFGSGGLIKGERFLSYLYARLGAATFEELDVPLKLVAADYWSREQVIFESGDLLTAIRASMAMPLVFSPVRHDGRVLVDGSTVNPVPYDIIMDQCDLTVAVDVMGMRTQRAKPNGRPRGRRKHADLPPLTESVLGTYQLMMHAIMAEKIKRAPPDIYIEVDMTEVRALEFYKFSDIYRQAAPAKERLKRQLSNHLE